MKNKKEKIYLNRYLIIMECAYIDDSNTYNRPL